MQFLHRIIPETIPQINRGTRPRQQSKLKTKTQPPKKQKGVPDLHYIA